MHNASKLMKWLSISRLPKIGPKSFWKILNKDPNLENIQGSCVEDEILAHKKQGFNLCAAFEDLYPIKLHDLDDTPPLISYGGNLNLLQRPCLAIVGARNASVSGKKMAYMLAKELSEAGFTIVSGLARGIDAAAHEGALPSATVAVMAGGVDYIYPKENETLYHNIFKNGCVISEMPIHTTPSAGLFPKRNRLVASLSVGIIVIEAAQKSGSLITAHLANDLGRDIFVVPGSPFDLRSKGGNNLIKQGAMLIDCAEDIITYYQSRLEKFPLKEEKLNVLPKIEQSPSTDHSFLLNSLSAHPIAINDFIEQHSAHDPNFLFKLISEWELKGIIKRTIEGKIYK